MRNGYIGRTLKPPVAKEWPPPEDWILIIVFLFYYALFSNLLCTDSHLFRCRSISLTKIWLFCIQFKICPQDWNFSTSTAGATNIMYASKEQEPVFRVFLLSLMVWPAFRWNSHKQRLMGWKLLRCKWRRPFEFAFTFISVLSNLSSDILAPFALQWQCIFCVLRYFKIHSVNFFSIEQYVERFAERKISLGITAKTSFSEQKALKNFLQFESVCICPTKDFFGNFSTHVKLAGGGATFAFCSMEERRAETSSKITIDFPKFNSSQLFCAG